MAKFTKLNIGDSVASSGGRVFKKLSSMLQLAAPTLSLDGDMLTITDNSKLATSFDILVDGEVKYTYAKYLYNGVELPPLPNLQGYPYCWIRKHTTNDQYQLVFAPSPWYYKDNGMYCSDSSATEPWYNITISTANNATGWTFNKNATGFFSVDDARPVFWSNYDIPNGSATATDIYFEGTEPVLSGTNLTSATFDLSTLDLEEGTYSISVVAKADGYLNSAESEAVSYAESVIGTWILKDTLNSTTITSNVNFTSNGFSGKSFTQFDRTSEKLIYRVSGSVYYAFENGAWTNSGAKTITITGMRTDAPTSETALLTWLKANATKTA